MAHNDKAASTEFLTQLRPPEECTVLVVDDEPRVVEIITYFLEAHGYHIISAANGKQALKTIKAEEPDVVVMDVMMPEMDGIEACRRLKRSPRTQFLPVILVSAKGDTETRVEGKNAGADEFLDKPVNELELAARVRTLLRARLLYEQVEATNRELEERVARRTAELQEAYEQLQELDRVKSDIISNVSHELRTPLQHIKSSVALLTGDSLPQTQADLVRETVDTAIESLVRLIEDIINLGEGDKTRIESVVIADIFAEAAVQNRATHKRRIENLVIEVEEDLPPVRGDARALARVVFHLLDNALKFSEDDSEVVLAARSVAPEAVRVSVTDHGIGIAEKEREHIFEPFYQVDSSSTRRYPGVGVGLALVKLILDGHGVRPYLESVPRQGTTVWFDLEAASLD